MLGVRTSCYYELDQTFLCNVLTLKAIMPCVKKDLATQDKSFNLYIINSYTNSS